MNRYAPLLRNNGFRAVWAAAIVSGLGDRIAAIALYLLIYRLTGNPVDLGILAATQIVPAILLGPVAGVICDRTGRKGIMVSSDLVSAMVVASIPLVSSTVHVYALSALLGCGRQFAGPARMALLPDVVGEDLLGAANGLLMLTRNIVLLVGPAVGGALVAWRGTDPAFWFDAATFVVSAAILALWRFSEPVRGDVAAATRDGSIPARMARLYREAADGLAGVTDSKPLRLAFGFFAVLTFVTAMQQPLIVVFVKEILRGTDVQLGVIISAAGLGGILGAVAGGLVVGKHRPMAVIAAMTGLDGILLVVFAMNRSYVLALILFACFGALSTLVQIALATFLQQNAPDDRRGRTFGWLGTVIGPMSLAAVFLGPLAAAFVGVVAVLALCGVAEVAMAGAGLWSRRPEHRKI